MLNKYNRQDVYDKQKKSLKVARFLCVFWPLYHLYLKELEASVLSALLLAIIYVVFTSLAIPIHAIGTILLLYTSKYSVADYNYKIYKRVYYVKTIDNS